MHSVENQLIMLNVLVFMFYNILLCFYFVKLMTNFANQNIKK